MKDEKSLVVYKGLSALPIAQDRRCREIDMKISLLFVLVLVALAAGRSKYEILNFELDNQGQQQKGLAGKAVKGQYSWTAPDGNEYYVKYEADSFGYRVLEANVVPQAPTVNRNAPEDDNDK
ncbi:larval cuticle protein 16/17-like [Palaemon carinicauda]|uniref:larval cuticle protein 16/17-like n=1 Tax=Palaemon carinicauda TaxID=392227 RepID=UPI0035B5EACD